MYLFLFTHIVKHLSSKQIVTFVHTNSYPLADHILPITFKQMSEKLLNTLSDSVELYTFRGLFKKFNVSNIEKGNSEKSVWG